ncbi:MAG: hypothetical protein GC162_11075 [Planctomycetes bacterium]|nr:hypothetical protein [Planctomycetota bacterium]
MKAMMIKTALLFAVVGLLTFSQAQAGEKVTLTGKMVCAKCALKEASKCQNALIVKDGDKEVTYYLVPNATSKDFHENVCHGPKEGVTVTGEVTEHDGKKMIAATEIKG